MKAWKRCQKEITSDNLNFLREVGSQVIFCRQEVRTEKGLEESSGSLGQKLSHDQEADRTREGLNAQPKWRSGLSCAPDYTLV